MEGSGKAAASAARARMAAANPVSSADAGPGRDGAQQKLVSPVVSEVVLSVRGGGGGNSNRSLPPPVPTPRTARRTAAPKAAPTRQEQRVKVFGSRHREVLEDRERLQQQVREKAAKQNEAHNTNFQALMDEVSQGRATILETSRQIADHLALHKKKQSELYQRWDTEVLQRVENQLATGVQRPLPARPGFREELLRSDDPLKAYVRTQQEEETFVRAARSVLAGPDEQMTCEKSFHAEARSRPILPIQNWDQLHHYATPYGHFTRSCRSQTDDGFHSARRMGEGAHRLDESDGVAAAGKCKTRFERNHVFMLEGPLARRGESARFKTESGASCGAPCQDHYHYEQGNAIVDLEFPAGRRTFAAA